MPNRSYLCLNRNCVAAFNSSAERPTCPRCKGRIVKWLPQPVNVSRGTSKSIDATARGLADSYGMTNYNTPVVGRRAAPPAAAEASNVKPFDFGAGWRANLPTDAQGRPVTMCVPTGLTSKLKGSPTIDKKVPVGEQGRQLGA